ncbi:MAG: hypothetical protein LH613_17275 [Chamaesiphon sp.]|nr:hypothetical protein [Chamaesiphon sp.]
MPRASLVGLVGGAYAFGGALPYAHSREFLPPLTWVQVERGTPSVRVENVSRSPSPLPIVR